MESLEHNCGNILSLIASKMLNFGMEAFFILFSLNITTKLEISQINFLWRHHFGTIFFKSTYKDAKKEISYNSQWTTAADYEFVVGAEKTISGVLEILVLVSPAGCTISFRLYGAWWTRHAVAELERQMVCFLPGPCSHSRLLLLCPSHTPPRKAPLVHWSNIHSLKPGDHNMRDLHENEGCTVYPGNKNLHFRQFMSHALEYR